VPGEERASYGEQIFSTLFQQQNLFHMMRFAGFWPDEHKVVELAERSGMAPF